MIGLRPGTGRTRSSWVTESDPPVEVRLDHPRLDPATVWAARDPAIVGQPWELCIQAEAAIPPVVEPGLATTHGTEPVGCFSFDWQLQLA